MLLDHRETKAKSGIPSCQTKVSCFFYFFYFLSIYCYYCNYFVLINVLMWLYISLMYGSSCIILVKSTRTHLLLQYEEQCGHWGGFQGRPPKSCWSLPGTRFSILVTNLKVYFAATVYILYEDIITHIIQYFFVCGTCLGQPWKMLFRFSLQGRWLCDEQAAANWTGRHSCIQESHYGNLNL